MKEIVKFIIVGLIFSAFSATAHCMELMGADIHGFLSQGYLQSSNYNYHGKTTDGSFEFNEIGVNFVEELFGDLLVGLQLFSRDFGKMDNNEITLDWAYADYRLRDWLGIRVGKLKIPQGLYNETRDVDSLRTWIFLPTSVYAETTRTYNLAMYAAGIYGNLNLGNLGRVSYQLLGGTQELDKNDSRLVYNMRAETVNYTAVDMKELTVDWRYAVSLMWDTPAEGLRISATYNEAQISGGATVTIPEFGTFNAASDYNSVRYSVGSIEYVWQDLLLVAEYILSQFDRDDSNDAGIAMLSGNVKQDRDGWYAGAAYRLFDWLEIGGYYSELYNNMDDRSGENYNPAHRAWLKDICLTTRFDITEYFSFKLEGHNLNGTTGLYPVDNLPEGDQQWWDEGESWNMFAAKVTFTF